MNSASKIFVAGARGMVGSAIVRRLEKEGYTNLLTPNHGALELLDAGAVKAFFEREKPEFVFLAAAKVGGILANNSYPADFIYRNLVIETNLIHQSFLSGVKRLLFLGSSCIYPKECPQPMKEDHLMTGPLEPTNSPYALAKIAGIEMCWSYNRQHGTCFIPVMPTNLYGPNDNFDLETSHVLPALIRKFHEAKVNEDASVVVWGSGRPMRELLHVDDLARACLFVMNHGFEAEALARVLINIGTGKEITIQGLAELVGDVVGFKGRIVYDAAKPDGTMRKLLDVSRLEAMGWKAGIGLRQGIEAVYQEYCRAAGN